jgi:hypothetical protein
MVITKRLVISLVLAFNTTSVLGERFKYIDSSGNIIFVDSLYDVPAKYRNQVLAPTPTPTEEQRRWLEERLRRAENEKAQANREKERLLREKERKNEENRRKREREENRLKRERGEEHKRRLREDS